MQKPPLPYFPYRIRRLFFAYAAAGCETATASQDALRPAGNSLSGWHFTRRFLLCFMDPGMTFGPSMILAYHYNTFIIHLQINS